jgi:hypothetical protein
MSELARIADEIYRHEFDMFSRTCSCGEFMDSGPGAKRVRHNHAEHVAEAVIQLGGGDSGV